MGFGLLFIGYFLEFLLRMSKIGVFTHVIGYMVMFMGLSRLRLYCRTFSYALYTTLPLMVVAVYRTFSELPQWFNVSFPFVTNTVTTIVGILDTILLVLFHIFLAVALMTICRRTGVTKNAVRAMQNMVIVALYGVLNLSLTIAKIQNVPLYGVALLMQLIWVFANLLLLGSCYMRICPAGQENVERPERPSRFALVNHIREKYHDSKERARQKDDAYRQKKQEDRKRQSAASGSSRARKRAEIKAAREAAKRRDDERL